MRSAPMTPRTSGTADMWDPDVLDGIVQCRTCGVEYDAGHLPEVCPICADERQYLPSDGRQHWTDPARSRARAQLVELEEGLYGIDVDGEVGIGQQAKVLVAQTGTVMVDVPAVITPEIVDEVRELGPMRAIIPSHPHMYGLLSAWSAALGDSPVLVSAKDAHWLGRSPGTVRRWDGIIEVVPGVTAAVLGGHFPGAAVVHMAGPDGGGVLLSGDTIAACPDGHSVTFMRFYPNKIPLSPAVVERIARDVRRFRFDRLYDNFTGRISRHADAAVQRSAVRYAQWAGGAHDDLTGVELGSQQPSPAW